MIQWLIFSINITSTCDCGYRTFLHSNNGREEFVLDPMYTASDWSTVKLYLDKHCCQSWFLLLSQSANSDTAINKNINKIRVNKS